MKNSALEHRFATIEGIRLRLSQAKEAWDNYSDDIACEIISIEQIENDQSSKTETESRLIACEALMESIVRIDFEFGKFRVLLNTFESNQLSMAKKLKISQSEI